MNKLMLVKLHSSLCPPYWFFFLLSFFFLIRPESRSANIQQSELEFWDMVHLL